MLLSVEQQKWVMAWLAVHKVDRCPVCGQQTFRIGHALFERPEDRPKVQIFCSVCGGVLFFDASIVFNPDNPLLIWNSQTHQIELDPPQPEGEDFNPS
ncbi:MAG: hypothetical protein P4L50_24925 [Anaerolineaceae bacterium]|nr:hypothetical protein [Anaerolineaceae bacterium]